MLAVGQQVGLYVNPVQALAGLGVAPTVRVVQATGQSAMKEARNLKVLGG